VRFPLKMMRKVALIGAVGGTLYGGLAAGLMYQSSNEKAEVEKGDAKDKVFIVTGANSGIGREIAHQLARERGKVIMACRDMSKCEEERQKIVLDTRNKYVYCRQCDLASFQSIKDFVAQFNKQEEKCDALINNAGIMKCRKMHTQDGIELQLGTNHMGPYLLSHLLRPRLKNSGQGRIVYLTNLDYRQGLINFEDLNSDRSYDPATAFYQSQLANILAVQSLSKEFLEDKIMVYAAYPGLCDTQIERHTGLNKSISGSLVANNLLWFMHRSPEEGAATPLHCALAPSLANTTGVLLKRLQKEEIEAFASDQILVKKMEAVSKYWVGLLDRKRSQSEAGHGQHQQKETGQMEEKPTSEQHLAAVVSNKTNKIDDHV